MFTFSGSHVILFHRMNFIFGIIFCLFYPDIGLAKELWSPGELEKAYSKPKKEILKEKLSSRQFEVTQKDGTEPAFVNEYWNNKEQGIYVDIVSGEPLFSSEDKFDSGTGWPSFTRPLDDSKVVKKSDRSHGMERTEVRSKHADSHLGHVFNDGPAPEGKRYCINSASLRFVPLNKMKDQGYAAYLKYFQKKKTEKTSKSSKYE